MKLALRFHGHDPEEIRSFLEAIAPLTKAADGLTGSSGSGDGLLERRVGTRRKRALPIARDADDPVGIWHHAMQALLQQLRQDLREAVRSGNGRPDPLAKTAGETGDVEPCLAHDDCDDTADAFVLTPDEVELIKAVRKAHPGQLSLFGEPQHSPTAWDEAQHPRATEVEGKYRPGEFLPRQAQEPHAAEAPAIVPRTGDPVATLHGQVAAVIGDDKADRVLEAAQTRAGQETVTPDHYQEALRDLGEGDLPAELGTREPAPTEEQQEPPDTSSRRATGRREYVDVGEKIGGARKDVWKAIMDGRRTFTTIDFGELEERPEEAARAITKAHLLHGASPQELRDGGLTGNVAYLATQVFGAIAPKPGDSPEQRRAFARGLERVQRAMMAANGPDDVLGALKDMSREHRGFLMTPAESAQYERMQASWRQARQRFQQADSDARPAYNEMNRLGSEVSGIRYDGRLSEVTKQARIAELQPQVEAATARWKALNAAARKLADEARALSPMEFAEGLYKRDRANPDSWHNAYQALGDRFVNILKGKGAFWETHAGRGKRMDPQDWSWSEAKEPGERESTRTVDRLPVWERKVPDDVQREGGSEVAFKPQDLVDRFGIRGVEYGNWMDEASSQHHTQRAGEALMDLAEVLGIPHQQVSYNGRLAMAFGARGKGKALAHYEPDRKVINMTKFNGGGSLAHEWGHFMDNILAVVGHEGQAGHTSFLSAGEPGPHVAPEVKAAYEQLNKAMHEGDFRPARECDGSKNRYRSWPAVDRVLAAHDGDGQAAYQQLFAQDRGHRWSTQQASKIGHYLAARTGKPVKAYSGEGKSHFAATAHLMGPYWSDPREMFARAFDAYVADKLKARGMKNSYLTAGTDEDLGFAVPIMGQQLTYSPHPCGAERERIHAAFDRLIEAVKSSGMLAKAARKGA